MNPLQGLYFITPEASRDRISLAEAALRGGARWVQYRDKSTQKLLRLREVEILLSLCRKWNAQLIINDDVELCAVSGADGVHLGEEDLSITMARARLGSEAIIGVSCYNSMEHAQQGVDQGADYIAFGSVYPSSTKPQARRISIEQLKSARSRFTLPICAIGGITPENAEELVTLGIDLIAVLQGISQAKNPERAAQQIARLFSRPSPDQESQMHRSSQLFSQAQVHLPGGVNSPVRAFKGVGGTPVFMQRAEGAYMFDADGNRYIDYIGSWGPMVAGHAHPGVIAAVREACLSGLSFGCPTELEVTMAEKICTLVPSMEMVRMTSSGTEATMSAIRLARGFTGRDRIVKFEGNYHGHGDALLVKAGSGALTLGQPSSPGVPSVLAELTTTLNYNDSEGVRNWFATHGNSVACIIVEPIAGNMNCIPPLPGFLETLRELCDKHSAILIFDEVMTGFRVASGCAQELYGVSPDLTTLGKIIGGGMPVGAFGGRRDIMEHLAPIGPVYQAGTLSGNPIAMTAGIKTLEILSQPGFHAELQKKTETLTQGLLQAAATANIPITANQVPGMFGLFFTNQTVTTYAQALQCNLSQFRKFFHGMLSEGIYFAPSAFEAGFISSVHSETDLQNTIEAAQRVFSRLEQ